MPASFTGLPDELFVHIKASAAYGNYSGSGDLPGSTLLCVA
jgi:hypothetical protein